MNATPFGFHIVGRYNGERRLVDQAGAFLGYASCDKRASVDSEAYLSAFRFGEDFRERLQSTGSVKGFDGPCWSPWLWFDIDRANLDAALRDARRLALFLGERYRLDDDAILAFFSGSKGFHLGLPTSLWRPEPSATFNFVCRRLAEAIAAKAGVTIDTGVYDCVRAFRAPNSRHPKTGLHKRRLSHDELQGWSLDAVRQMAAKPAPFDLPTPPANCEVAKGDWNEAAELVRNETEAKATRTANGNGKPTLNRQTFVFIRDGADEGDRHRLLYSAARNLGEFGCPPGLAHALLTEAGRDCGLAPKDVHRQIECGLKDQGPPPIEQPATPSVLPVADAGDVQTQLAALWQSPAPAAVVELPPPTVPSPSAEPIPDNVGDAWEHPVDRLDPVDSAPALLDFPSDVYDNKPYCNERGQL